MEPKEKKHGSLSMKFQLIDK
jgi:hypothetical protein